MRVWLVKTGEPLPVDQNQRLFRMGLLAQALVNRGHSVTWWTSTFDHFSKTQLSRTDSLYRLRDRYEIRLLRSPGYRKNSSIARVLDHIILAGRFRRAAEAAEKPDIIVCSYPTIGLTLESCRFGTLAGIPVVIDIRDLWPETLVGALPDAFHGVFSRLVGPVRSVVGKSLSRTTGITGVTAHYVDWGLAMADRKKGPLDQVFPLAYPSGEPESDAQRRALKFWRDRGVGEQTGITVCFFGTIGRHFDFETVTSAAGILSKRGLPVRFVICGDGDELETWRKIASPSSNMLFPGWIGKSEIWALLRLSTLGLAPYVSTPSMSRNVPNKILEYLSAGLPVVTSLGGSVRKMIEDSGSGVWYPDGDAESLAEALARICETQGVLHSLVKNTMLLRQKIDSADRVYEGFAVYLEKAVAEWSHGSAVRR